MVELDLQAFLDRQPVRPAHLAVLTAGMLMMFVDGFDIFMLGRIAPAVAHGFGARPQAMTQVFVAQQIGLAAGAFLVTPLADLFGRRLVLAVSALAFGVLTVAGVFAPSLAVLAVLRGAAGLFLAGVVPMVIAFVGEVMPARVRGGFISLTLVGYSLGNAAGGAAAAWLLTRYGWTSGFWVGGLMSMTAAVLLLLLTPESPQFLAARDPSDPRLRTALRRLDPEMGDDVRIAPPPGQPSGGAVGSLLDVWGSDRARATALFWIASGISIGSITLLASWLPTFFQQMAGVPIPRFGAASFFAYLCGIPGIYLIGYLFDRFSPRWVVASFYFGLAAAMVLLARVPFGSAAFLPVLVAWSLCQGSGQAGMNLLISRAYPPRIRSTALGWAGGVGRIVSIFTPFLGGYAVAHRLGMGSTLGALAVCSLVVAGVVLAAGRRTAAS